MKKEIDLTLKPEFISEYRDGYPLISKESVVDWSQVTDEGTIINLTDAKGDRKSVV